MYFSLLTQTNDNIPPHTHMQHTKEWNENLLSYFISPV